MMKNIIFVLSMAFSFSSHADMTLEIVMPKDTSVNANATYLNSKTGLGCGHLNDDFKRVGDSFDQPVSPIVKESTSTLYFKSKLDSRCKPELMGTTVWVTNPLIRDPKVHGNIDFRLVDENQDDHIQAVIFNKIESPYGDFYATNDKINVGPNGMAKVEVSFSTSESTNTNSGFAGRVSPAYDSFNKIKTAVTAIVDSFEDSSLNAGDFKIISLITIVKVDEQTSEIQVIGSGWGWNLSVEKREQAPGMIGAPKYKATILSEGTVREDLPQISLNQLNEAIQNQSLSAAFNSVEVKIVKGQKKVIFK